MKKLNEPDERIEEGALDTGENNYRQLFESMLDGCALHEIICDDSGHPVDYRFLSINPAFEQITGLHAAEIVGRTVREVIPEIESVWIERYGEVALTGTPTHFEHYNSSLNKDFSVTSYRPSSGKFAVIFRDITESKQREALMLKREAMFNESQLITGIGSYELDLLSGKWTNSEMLNTIFGIPREYDRSVEGWAAIVHPDDRNMMVEYFTNEVLAQRQDFDKEYRIIRQNDRCERWVHGLGKLSFDDRNRPVLMRGTIQDITEQKANKQKIKQLNMIKAARTECLSAIVRSKNEEELLPEICRILVETAGIKTAWIGRVDPVTKLIIPYASEGMDKDCLLEIKISTDADLARGRGPTGTAIRENRVVWIDDVSADPNVSPWYDSAVRFDWKSAAALPLRVMGEPKFSFTIYSSERLSFQGEITELLISLSETISFALDSYHADKERRVVEDELKKLRQAVEQSANTIIITDSKGTIEYVNAAFEKVSGYRADEAIGHNPRVLKSGHHTDLFYQKLWSTISSGKNWQGEFHNKRKDGSLYWENATISPVFSESGELTHYIAVKEDITARQSLEADLKNALELAEAANRAKGEFLGVMSHELRTPLNGILGFANLTLDDNRLPSEIRDNIELIESSGKNLLRLLEDIMNFSRIEGGELQFQSIPFSLSELAWKAIRLVEEGANAKNLQLFVTLGEDVPGTVLGDPDRVQQVLLNLLRNAIKFTPKGSVTLSVSLSSREGNSYRVCFAVEDTGSGIPENELEKIFLPFTQGDSSLSRKHEGVGMGLTISKRLVEKMGSTLTVKSQVDKGSTFSFELTFLPETSTKPEAEDADSGLGELNKEFAQRFPVKILIAEDNPINLKLAVVLLKKLGYEDVFTANHGGEALAILENEKIDLIFMDLQMPVMDGMEATRQLRSLEAKNPSMTPVKIVALTANASADIRKECFETGMNHYVSKPFNTRVLAESIALRN